MLRRLYLQIYLTFVGIAVACVAVVALIAGWMFEHERGLPRQMVQCLGAVGNTLPPSHVPRIEHALERRASQLGGNVTLFSPEGERVASTGPPLPAPDPRGHQLQWFHEGGRPGVHVRLEDGRWLGVAGPPRPGPGGPRGFAATVVIVLVIVGLGALPVARRVTRRVEALQRGVQEWGEGQLSARVPVEGKDEVAELARKFNWAADRIERLVERQRRVLAHASHELRSPLARLRMAVELLDDGSPERQRLVASAGRDAEELDALIGDVLLAARLDTAGGDVGRERVLVDLAALAADEAERAGGSFAGERAMVLGDIAMLRRLVRNLVENARKYGQGGAIEVRLDASVERVRLEVADRGPGLPAGEEERVFEPFYRPRGHSEGQHGGVGLGLSLVRQVAEHHHGRAGYSPREGGGSIFWVELPASVPLGSSGEDGGGSS